LAETSVAKSRPSVPYGANFFLCVEPLEIYKCPEICFKNLLLKFLFVGGTPGFDGG